MLYIILPIILASVFLLYNMFFSKYLEKKNIEGLTNNDCDSEKNTLIYKNNSTVSSLKQSVDNLMKQVNDLVLSNTNQESRIETIEKEIQKAQNSAQVAQANADKQKAEFTSNTPSFN